MQILGMPSQKMEIVSSAGQLWKFLSTVQVWDPLLWGCVHRHGIRQLTSLEFSENIIVAKELFVGMNLKS